jgi:endonuclease YncB( thermonuclease family)
VACRINCVWHTRRLVGAASASLVLIGSTALADLGGPARIVDGDTLEIAGQRVRLLGVDAPELDQLCQRAGHEYHCGEIARATLWDLIGGLDVSCAPEGASPAPHGVILATCSAGGISLNEGMVRSGWALADPQSAADRYLAIQADAEQARRGLWRGEFEPPWQWRQAPAAGGPEG